MWHSYWTIMYTEETSSIVKHTHTHTPSHLPTANTQTEKNTTGIRIRIQIRMDPYVLALSDPHPDLLVRGTDPRIRIRTKISRIPNTSQQVPTYRH